MREVTMNKKKIFKSKGRYFLFLKDKRGKRSFIPVENDAYFSAFSKGYAFRTSCYECKYAQLKRIGDFTIGDCDSHYLYDFHIGEAV